MAVAGPLSPAQLEEFRENGVLVVGGFYDLPTEIEPIQRYIYELIGLLLAKYGVSARRAPFAPGSFESGYPELLAANRRYAAEIYDAVKHIPAFARLACSKKNEGLFNQVRNTDLGAFADRGSGIRIDNPGEEKFKAPWHQEYPAVFRSLDGITLWSPLLEVTPERGPVVFCVGSHKDGLVRVHDHDPRHPEKKGAYALILENEEARVNSYPQIAPTTKPGDLVLIDYLVLHRSGTNISDRSRWSMQMRYFNFRDPEGIRISWKGGFNDGVKIEDVYPDLLIKSGAA